MPEHIARRYWAAIAASLIGTLASAGCHSGGGTACSIAAECWNTPESKSLGRCGPKEVGCVQGECAAACPSTCRMIEDDRNPCVDPARICNESPTGPSPAYCTALPIACTTEVDCPIYRPRDANGQQSTWTCTEGFCRYPGLSYPWE